MFCQTYLDLALIDNVEIVAFVTCLNIITITFDKNSCDENMHVF